MSGAGRTARFILAATLAFLAAAPAARAGCTVDAAGGVAFGTYNPFDASPLDSTGTITITCTDPYTSPVQVKLSKGSSSTFSPRTLVSGSHHLEFNLFLDAAHSTVWGDGTEGTSYATLPVGDGANPITVYGRVPAHQTSAYAGSYGDSLVVTIEF